MFFLAISKNRENNKMEFSFQNLFECVTLWNRYLEGFTIFVTPYMLPIVDFGIRSYVWIQDLPFFQQQKKCKYAEILASKSWNYTGFLVHTKTTIPFCNEYSMIHHYGLGIEETNTALSTSADTIDTIYLQQNENACISRRTRTPCIKTEIEKSKIRFLYVEFILKGNTVSLDIPEEMMQIGNEIFTPAFVYRLLDHSSTNVRFLFDLNYRLILVDEHLNSTTLDSGKYVVLEKDTYRVQPI